MIKIQSGFYYVVDQQPSTEHKSHKKVEDPKNQTIALQVIGDIKGYIQHVATEVARIKQLKAKQKQQQLLNKLILDQLIPSNTKNTNIQKQSIRLEIAVPPEIYELEQRIGKLQQKIINDQIVRQKIQRKGKLAERAKLLNMQIQKLIEKPQTINININNYCKNLEEKQQQSKTLFLYEAFTKTQTLSEEIQMLDVYLKNLNEIMTKFQALPSHKAIVDNHEKILQKRQKNKERIRKLYQYMKEQHEKVVKQIDSL